ncbi:hypothetical protein EXN66_Car016049 [Channa argus]|uniref:Uncharacterized protein n=1 Tax=Channa argus TaxID=215402 RepID=A0A6G1QCT7_CHAAH|nr:hypothetical protein EXN66_Car016049 [Channa argus]
MNATCCSRCTQAFSFHFHHCCKVTLMSPTLQFHTQKLVAILFPSFSQVASTQSKDACNTHALKITVCQAIATHIINIQ